MSIKLPFSQKFCINGIAVLFILIFNSVYSQTTFTATNVKVMDTLTNYNVIKAESLTTNDTLRAKDHVVLEQNLEVQGDISLSGNLVASPTSTTSLGDLKVSGNTVFNGVIKNSQLAGAGDRLLYVDGSGNFKIGGPPTPGVHGSCIANAFSWFEGGNMNVANNTIGTCDYTDFILKSNNIQSIWLKPDGKLGFGNSNPADQFHFSGGDSRFDGKVGIGTSATPTEKFEVFGYSKFGGAAGNIKIGHDNGNAVLDNYGAGSFLVNAYSGGDVGICIGSWLPGGGGKVRVGNFLSAQQHVEIGDPTWGIAANNSPANNIALEMHVNSGKAIRIKTYDGTVPMFEVFNSGSLVNKTTFMVNGNGQTQIGIRKPIVGSIHDNAMLSVDGKILARSIYVNIHNTVWADYVFSKSYELMPLQELKKYIEKEKHLPGIPSGMELEQNGLPLGEIQAKQMEKIEELYLYTIDLKAETDNLRKEVELLKKQNIELIKALKK